MPLEKVGLNPIKGFEEAIVSAVKPAQSTSLTIGRAETLKRYYRMSIIPFLLYVVVSVAIFYLLTPLPVISNSFLRPSNPLGSISDLSNVQGTFALLSQNLIIYVIAAALLFWIGIPLLMLMNALILHIFGKWIFAGFRKGYSNTLTATLYSFVPTFLFLWLVIVPVNIFSGPMQLLLLLWSFAIYVIALSNQQAISRRRAVSIILGGGFVLTVVLLVAMPFIGAFVHSTFLSSIYSSIGG